MKKIILMLLLLISVDVNAEKKYTDYEFKEYIEEKLEDDELHKYEEVKINKFYSTTETDVTYLNTPSKDNYQYIDTNDYYIEEKYTSFFPLISYSEGRISMEVVSYPTDELVFMDVQNFNENIRNVEIFYDDRKLDAVTTFNQTSHTVNFELLYLHHLSNLKIAITHNNKEDYKFLITLINSYGGERITKEVTLKGNVTRTIINFKSAEEMHKLADENNLQYSNTMNYYVEEKRFYKHYNLQKNYYIDSEEEAIEGYTYNPNESYTMYKVYERQIIESDDKGDSEDSNSNNNENNEINTPEKGPEKEPEKVDKPKEENTNSEIGNNINKNPQYTSMSNSLTSNANQKNPPKDYTKPSQENHYVATVTEKEQNAINTVDKQEDEKNTTEATVDTSKDSESKKVLGTTQEYDDEEDGSYKILIVIGIILIIISIILSIIHIISVKYDN